MPDYRVIPSNPIVDAIDRRGSSYMLAGPVTTDFSAGVKGLMEGLDFGAELTDKIYDTRRENDPDMLAAEQLRRELQNEQIQAAIRTANIENTLDEQFGFGDRALDQIDTTAGIGQKLATTRKTSIDAQLAEQYGPSKEQSTIDKNYAAADKASIEAKIARQYGGQEKQSIIDKNKALAAKHGRVGEGVPNYELRDTSKAKNFRVLQTPTLPSAEVAVSPEASQIASQLQLSEAEVQAELANKDSSNYQKRTEAQDQTTQSTLTTKKAKDEYDRTSKARTNLEEALVHIEDVDYQKKPAYPGVLGKIAIANQLYEEETTPERKALRAAEISAMVRSMGVDGAQQHIDGLEGEDKKYHETILSAAIANSGDTSLYTEDMKTIIGAGLSAKNAADPEKTYSQIEELINNGPINVEDPTIQEELPFSVYVMAASRASQRGTRPYSILQGQIPISSGTADIAGGGQESQPGVQFLDMQGNPLSDSEGNKIYAPKPTNLKEKKELSLVMKVASRQQQSIPQRQQVQKTTQGLQEQAVQQQQPSEFGAPAQAQGNRNPTFFKSLTDESQIPESFEDNIFTIAQDRSRRGEKTPGKLGIDQTKAYYPTVKDITEDVTKDTTTIRGNQEQIQQIDLLMNYAYATKNADYIGPNVKLTKMQEFVKSYLPGGLVDEEKKRLQDMFSRAQMLAKLSKLSGQVKAFDTPAEMENLIQGTISQESTIGTINTLKMMLEGENRQKNALNEIRNIGIAKQLLEPTIRRAENAYLSSDESKTLIKNPKMGQPGEADFLTNPNFLDGAQFLGLKDRPSSFKPAAATSTGNSQTNVSPDVVGNSQQAAQEADTVKKKSPAAQQSTDGQPSSSIKENLTPEAESKYQGILKSVSKVLQSGNEAVGFKPILGDREMFSKTIQDPEAENNRQKVVSGTDYLADTILFNKGEEIVNLVAGLSGQDRTKFEAARQLARDEFAKENKWTALGMDAFGTVVDILIVNKGLKAILGPVASGFEATFPNAAAKVTSTLATLGKTSGGTPHAELAGQAILDGALFALRQEDGSDLWEFLSGAAFSGAIQKAFVPIANGLKGVSAQIFRLLGSSDPGDVAAAKKLVKEGVTKEEIIGDLEAAKQEGTDILGTQSPRVRGTFKGEARKGASRPGIVATEGERTAEQAASMSAAEQKAGLAGLRSADDISGDFQTAANQAIDEEVVAQTAVKEAGKAVTRSTAEKEQATTLAEILKTSSEAGKSGQQVVDDIAELIGVDAKSLSEGGAKVSGGTDTETLAQQTLKQLKSAKEVVGKLLRGGADNPGALFRKLEKKYAELDEGVIESLDNTLRDKFPQQAPGWINAIARSTEQLKTVESVGEGAKEKVKTAVINNSFRFLDELRQFVKTKDSGASKQVAEEIEQLIFKAGDTAIELKGGGKNVYSNFVKKQMPKLYKVEEGLETLIATQEKIANQLEKTGSGKLHDPLFTSAPERTKLNEAYGSKVGAVETNTRAYDEATKIIDALDSDKSQIKITDLADNFQEANTLANNQEFFAEKLIKQGSGAINRLKRTLGPREKGLLEEGVVKVLKRNLDSFKGNVEGGSFKPNDIFGLGDAEWQTVKELLGPEKAKLLESVMGKKTAIEKAIKIFETDAAARGSTPDSAVAKMSLRRMLETAGEFALDLMAAMGLKTAGQKEAEAIIKGLTSPPKELEAYLRLVTTHMETVLTKQGVASKMTGTSESARQQARILLYAMWSATQDSSSARKNTAHAEALKFLESQK